MDDTPDNEIIKGKYILLATGAGPVNLGIPRLDNVITSDQFLDIEGIDCLIILHSLVAVTYLLNLLILLPVLVSKISQFFIVGNKP